MTCVVLGRVFVGFEVFRILIDCIVGQMHKQIVKVVSIRTNILLRSKPCQAFPKYEYPQWINSINKTVNPHIELQVINEIWLVHILLDDILLTRLHINTLVVSCQVYTPTLA